MLSTWIRNQPLLHHDLDELRVRKHFNQHILGDQLPPGRYTSGMLVIRLDLSLGGIWYKA